MKELIKDMIEGMAETVEKLVPEVGDFEPVAVGFDNHNKDYVSDRFWLEVRQPPEGISQRDVKRGLFIEAGDEYHEAEIMMACGDKQEMLSKLWTTGFEEDLLRCIKKLDDFIRHPD
jgi:hypothetical protein